MRGRAWAATALAAGLLLSACATVPQGGATMAGVWRMARPAEFTDPREATPPIPPAPLKPELVADYQAARKRMADAEAEGRPFARDREFCIPDGVPRMLTTDTPLEFILQPDRVIIIHEFMTQVRRIYLDRTTHPEGDDLEEGFYGDSIGRWEGDTLVIDTVGLKPRVLLFNDAPRSPQTRVVERWRLIAPNILENHITVTDPVTLAEPWVVVRRFTRRPDIVIGESVCAEGNRVFTDAEGRLQLTTVD